MKKQETADEKRERINAANGALKAKLEKWIEPPCLIGDTVYVIVHEGWKDFVVGECEIDEMHIERYGSNYGNRDEKPFAFCISGKISGNPFLFFGSELDLGVRWFKTKDEAVKHCERKKSGVYHG